MISNTLLTISLLVSALAVPTEASWFSHGRFHMKFGRKVGIGAEQQKAKWNLHLANTSPSSTSSSVSYTYSVPNASIIAPSLTSQGMTVTSIVPIYEVCNTPGSNTTSCSTVFETITTTTCSTVLTYAFSKTTITDCSLNITFSSQSSYGLATTTILPTITPAPTVSPTPTPIPSPTTDTETYLQSIISYWYAPWQSLAANNPRNITLKVCKWDYWGEMDCTSVQEVWIVHTEYVLVSTTSTLVISTSLKSAAVLLLGPTQSVTAPAGNYTLSTQVTSSSMVANATTSVSTLSNTTSTTTLTSTITITNPPTTVTMTLSDTHKTFSTVTTWLSGGVTTHTVTVQPQPKQRGIQQGSPLKIREIQARGEALAAALLLG